MAVASTATALAAVAGLAAVVQVRRPRLVTAAGVVTLVGLTVVEAVRLGAWEDRPAANAVLLLRPVLLVPLAAAALVTAFDEHRRRRALDEVVDALSRAEPVRTGPVVRADFAGYGGAGWVDAHGRSVAEGTDSTVVLRDENGPIARLHLAAGARADDVLEALTPATRLALRNARLSAAMGGRLAELQASRRRVVEVTDTERTRIERDLHDGAQQRLVGVAFHLRAARTETDPVTAAQLALAEGQVLEVLANLRRLAHGTVPSVLADEGLASAVRELVGETPLEVRAEVQAGPGVPAAAARAAYVAIADVLGSAGPRSSAVVEVAEKDETLCVRVGVIGLEAPVEEDRLLPAADRVRALGGTWHLVQGVGHLDLEAVIPCGS